MAGTTKPPLLCAEGAGAFCAWIQKKEKEKKGGVYGHTAVLLAGGLLDAAAHHLRDCHAGDAQIVQGGLQLVKLGQLCNDGHLVHPGVVDAVVDDSGLPHHIQWPQMGYTTSEMAAE